MKINVQIQERTRPQPEYLEPGMVFTGSLGEKYLVLPKRPSVGPGVFVLSLESGCVSRWSDMESFPVNGAVRRVDGHLTDITMQIEVL